MKFLQIGDLHLGKSLHGLSLLPDQADVLEQILSIADEHAPDAILITGDVYDRSVPPTEAVGLLDRFLTRLARPDRPVYLTSGNHDSADRLAFGGRLLAHSGLFVAPVYRGALSCHVCRDAYGEIEIYLLPFIKPIHVRVCMEEDEGQAIKTYTDAVRWALREVAPTSDRRRVLVAHQYVTGAQTCDSEEHAVGGLDNVDASVFARFDYVALGHLHGAQTLEGGRIHYCGSPLCYSFSEQGHQKAVSMVELDGAGKTTITRLPLTPLRAMHTWHGKFAEVTAPDFRAAHDTNALCQFVLTDEDGEVDNVVARLRGFYPNVLHVTYDNSRTRARGALPILEHHAERDPLELFSAFYQTTMGTGLSEQQRAYLTKVIAQIWEEEI